jgi:hypothetical protein
MGRFPNAFGTFADAIWHMFIYTGAARIAIPAHEIPSFYFPFRLFASWFWPKNAFSTKLIFSEITCHGTCSMLE